MNFNLGIDANNLISAIGLALIHFLWQGVWVACGTALVLTMLRNSKPQTRYAVSCFALLLCLLLPLMEIWSRLKHVTTSLNVTADFTGVVQIGLPNSSLWPIATWLQTHLQQVVLAWLLMVMLLAVRFGLGLVWIHGLQTDQRTQTDAQWQRRLDGFVEQLGLKRNVKLRVVQGLNSPITVGLLQPMVFLPASLITGMPAPLLEALLAHEVAHISRFDYAINMVQHIIEMLLFFHPAVWWISKNIRNEREQIADDLAARLLGEPRRLALALNELAHIQFTQSQLVLAANGGNLMSRIKRLVKPEVQAVNWKLAISAVGLSAICLAAYAHAAITPSTPSTKLQDEARSADLVIKKNDEAAQRKKLNEARGADVRDVVVPAKFDFKQPNCQPEYPKEALKKNLTGRSVLAVDVEADGTITNVNITETSKHPVLDNAIREVFLSGACKVTQVGTVNGVPESTTAKIQYVWTLR